ncbi:MAG: toxin-antitoxin system YwqK family antitoxin [Gemmataceae bacterium]
MADHVVPYAVLVDEESGKLCTDFRSVNKEPLPDGRYRGIDQEGRSVVEIAYRAGLAHGAYVDYWSNDQVSLEGQFLNGKKHGTWHFYGEDGNLRELIEYEMGKEILPPLRGMNSSHPTAMLKLYKRTRAGIRYWEAWNLDGSVVVHEGKLGDKGKHRFCRPPGRQSAKRFIEEAARQPREQGYAEIDRADHTQVVVQFRLAGWGSVEDLNQGFRVEDVLNGELGWTGNGRTTGHDIGSGTFNIFCVVVDAELAVASILASLRKQKKLKHCAIAVEEPAGYRVAYPRRFKGDFKLV